MQATKEQIVLAGIFGVGIVALGVDRLVLSDGVSGPAHASAITTTLATPALVAPATAKVSPSLSQRLRALALYENLDVSPRSDAFSLDDRHAALRPSTRKSVV